MWLDTKITKGVMVLQFRRVKELCPQFADNIVENICQLNDCNFGSLLPQQSPFESAEVTYLCL